MTQAMSYKELVARLQSVRHWLLTSRLPGHEAVAVHAAEATDDAASAIEALDARLDAALLDASVNEGFAHELDDKLSVSLAERDRFREALKPFADAAELVEGVPDTSCAGAWITAREQIHLVPRVADLRRARSALQEPQQ